MLPVDLSLLEAATPTPAPPTPAPAPAPPPSSLVFAAGDIPSLLFIPPDAQHPQGTLLAAAATPNWEHSITMRRSHDGGSTWSEAVSPMQHAAGQPKCVPGAMACAWGSAQQTWDPVGGRAILQFDLSGKVKPGTGCDGSSDLKGTFQVVSTDRGQVRVPSCQRSPISPICSPRLHSQAQTHL